MRKKVTDFQLLKYHNYFLTGTEIEMIGKAFADEVFMVFANDHPNVEILLINANDDVKQMIKRVSTDLLAGQEKLIKYLFLNETLSKSG